MDRLPQELSHQIAGYVEYDRLENLRLVSKAFAAAAAPFLFQDIKVWIGLRSLQRLTAISEHPQLSQYPRRIFFSPLRFIDYQNDEQYKDRIVNLLERQEVRVSRNVGALIQARHMSAYRSYIQAQRLLTLDGLDVTILSSAFAQLPRLETIHVTLCPDAIGYDELVYAFGEWDPLDLLYYDCRQTLFVLVQALAASPTKLKVFKLGDVWRPEYYYGDYPDYYWSTAEYRFVPGRITYPAHHSYPPSISTKALLDTFCIENWETYSKAFRGLRELQLGDINVADVETHNLKCVPTLLRNLMQCASDLEIVSFPRIQWRTNLDSLMPSHGFKNLRELRLQHLQTSIATLNHLFCRIRYSIVKVELEDIDLYEDDTPKNFLLFRPLDLSRWQVWCKALVQFRALELSRLEVFILSRCPDIVQNWESSLQVQDYILKKTDKDPVVEERERQRERERERERAIRASQEESGR